MQVEYLPEKETTVRRTGFALVTEGTRVRFAPGMNEFESDEWKAVEKHPKIKQRIESGALKVQATQAQPKTTKTSQPES